MKLSARLLALALAVGSVASARAADQVVSVRSRSGQFLVGGMPAAVTELAAPSAPPATAGQRTNLVRLDPSLLAVSCERIKHVVLRELGASDQWRGKIRVTLKPGPPTETPITITASFFPDGWQYQVEVPAAVEGEKVVRALVQVLLLEMANRSAGRHPAELPHWLVEGFTGLAQASSETDLVVKSQPLKRLGEQNLWLGLGTQRDEAAPDPRRGPRELLAQHKPLTFEELCFPAAAHSVGEGQRLYQACAQLFLHELLKASNGQAALRQMLGELPQCLNWQTAFLRAFHAHFQRMLDVEKWWAVTVVNVTSRDQTRTWSRAVSLERLAEVLSAAAAVAVKTNALPVRSEVSLQGVIAEWDYARQKPVLQARMNQLQLLRAGAHPEVLPLVETYLLCLVDYLDRRGRAGFASNSRTQPTVNPKFLAQETVRRLDVLDAQREALRQKDTTAATASPTK